MWWYYLEVMLICKHYAINISEIWVVFDVETKKESFQVCQMTDSSFYCIFQSNRINQISILAIYQFNSFRFFQNGNSSDKFCVQKEVLLSRHNQSFMDVPQLMAYNFILRDNIGNWNIWIKLF
jgi:hypothetical protein